MLSEVEASTFDFKNSVVGLGYAEIFKLIPVSSIPVATEIS